jgi:trk system potassium uptake protein TrkH
LAIITLALLSCEGLAVAYHEALMPFLYSAVITAVLGVLFWTFFTHNHHDLDMHRKDAYFTVVFSWFIMGVVGALPYLFSRAIPLPVNAFFESVSGFTTTGSSILTDIEALPKSILFWRSLTHWIGGIGIIVLIIVILPSLKIGGYHLFTLESSLQEKLQPRIKAVGLRLLMIYVLLTLAEVLFLMFGHMNLYESVCHAFGTIATGGFSPKNTSIADYSPYIQYVVMVFMLLAGVNFAIHYYMLNRNFKKVKENEEVRFYLMMILIIGAIITAILFFKMHKPLELSFRESFFQVISMVTCTGFASADYLQWPTVAWMIIFFTMFLGGSTGSTAGGIKMVRHLVLFKNLRNIIRKRLSPNAVLSVHLNAKKLNPDTNNAILTFITVYFFVFAVGTFLLLLLGIDSKTASSSVATCMAGIGPGIGSVGPVGNFAHLPATAKLILTILMITGRLEIYPIIALFTRNFWKR